MKTFAGKPDTHVPYHCEPALRLFLRVVRDQQPDYFFDLGDGQDFWQLSFHEKVLQRRDLQYELDIGNEVLDRMDTAAPSAQKVITLGNHEHRWDRALQAGAGPFAALRSNSLDSQLNYVKRGWKVVPYRHSIQLGELHISHEFDRCGRNAHEQAIADVLGSAAMGHTHALNCVWRSNSSGQSHVGISCGWLGDVESIDYKHRTRAIRDWHHGFMWGHITAQGVPHVQAIPIIRVGSDYTCVVSGVFYSEPAGQDEKPSRTAQLSLF